MKYLSLYQGSIATALLFLSFQVTIFAQHDGAGAKWLGLHNIYYQDQSRNAIDTVFTSNNQQLVISEEDSQKALSFGFHYRLIGNKQSYHQFELVSFDRTVSEELVLTEIIGQQFTEPTRGFRQVNTNIRIGYRRGKLLSLHERITADFSLGVYPTYQRNTHVPVSSAGFPQRDLRIGIGLDARLGLNFQLHPNVNIGYSFVPLAGDWFWHQSKIENPILTDPQRTSTGFEMQSYAFENVLDFRNISLRYVIPAGK